MPEFRTAKERTRAAWANKYTSVAEGILYGGENGKGGPFPLHEYFKLGLVGKSVQMLEVNAGAALIDQMVADTMTELQIETEQDEAVQEWMDDTEYLDSLEETCRSFFANGYAIRQSIREADDSENTYTSINVDAATWYPTLPTFKYQKVKDGRIISVFSVDESGNRQWYAFCEHHTVGQVEHKLYKLDNANSLDGTEVKLATLPRFADLDKSVATDLDSLPIYQINRSKTGGKFFGESILSKVWGLLHEVSEIQTQLRLERIKHFRSQLAAPRESLARAQRLDNSEALPLTSKQAQVREYNHQAEFDLNQEIFPIPPGGQVPQFIQRDLEIVTKGMELIDNVLSKISALVGAPRSIFNLDEKGTVHVDTEKRKDRRYMRHILQAQRKVEWIVKKDIETVWKWQGKEIDLAVDLTSPFELTQEERVKLMREMNPSGTFVSQEEAIRQLWPDMTEEEREEMSLKIKEGDRGLLEGLDRNPVAVNFPEQN